MPDRHAADRLSARLRHAPVPEAGAAEERARRVVLAAVDGREPARRGWPRIAVAAAAALLLALGATLTPAGDAVATWVKGLVTDDTAPEPRPAITSLPAAGRLLVTGRGGAWVVRRDGSRRRLGPYGDVAWSPRGLFVAATRGRTLLAVEPGGAVHWALARPQPVHDPRWAAPTGYRIAYRTAGTMRVVAGDGGGDHLLVRGVAPVAAAWRPGTANVLALARANGAVEVWAADTVTRLRRARPAGEPVALAWAGPRLVVIHRAGVTVYDRRGRAVLDRPIPAVHAGAVSPSGHRVAVVAGGALSLVGLGAHAGSRVVYTAPDRLASVTWSPDGRLLLAARPRADQWVFLPVSGTAGVVADAGIARQFDPARTTPRGFPAVAGWAP